jgi:hypothetical protein
VQLALIDLEIRDGLPFVHGNFPAITDAAAAKVNDELVFIATKGP